MIYIKLNNPPESIVDLIVNFYQPPSGKIGGIDLRGVASYFDPECTKLQCPPNRLRSYEDTLELVRTYFPEATEEDVTRGILESALVKKVPLYIMTCSTIRRINYFYRNFGKVTNDIYKELCHSKYDSEKSWNERFADIGITNFEQVKKYLN